jgi:DNA-binding beta-propeller fold protein YncE/cytochrome c peroxidase
MHAPFDFRMSKLARKALMCVGLLSALHVTAFTQTVPNIAYTPDKVGSVLSTISSRYGFSQVAINRGRLIAISAQDGGGGFGHLHILNISDPSNPVTIRDDGWAEANEIREAHGWGFRGDTIVLQAQKGIMFWNISPTVITRRISYLHLPDVNNNDYNNAIWWTHWQGRYLYAGGTDNGLYIVDALDPVNPVFVKKIPVNQLGGFRVGSTHAVGNLLYLSGFDDGPSGISILDISDPVNPKLLSTTREISSYASMVNGNRVVLGARRRPANAAVVYDVSDPTKIIRIGKSPLSDTGGGGYVNFSDGYAFIGGKGGVKKYDMNHPLFPEVAQFTAGQADEGFPMPLGNLLFAGNDHHNYDGHGSGIIIHQAAPDTIGPSVNMVVPFDGSTRQAITSRIGLTFTDQIEGESLTPQNIVVREVGGDTVPGLIAHQTAILNFHPLSLLKANTQYEVLVRAGGVRDYVGNATPEDFRSTFTTGDRSDCRVNGPTSSHVSDSVSFVLVCQNPVTARIAWELGDGRTLPFQAGQHTIRIAYNGRGAYNIFARIEGELLGGSSIFHTVLFPPLPNRAANSTTILLDESLGRIWNVNADNNSVTVLNALTHVPLREIPVGKHPRTLALDKQGRVWVVNQDDASLSVINASNFTLIRSVALPKLSRPFGIVFAPDGAMAYVSLEAGGGLVRVNATTFEVSDSLPLFSSARGLAISADGTRVYVTRYISRGFQGTVAEVSTAPFGLVRTINLSYDNSVDSESSGGGVPNAVSAPAISPDGLFAWVPFKKDNVRRGLQSTEPSRLGPLTFESTVRTAVGQIHIGTGLEDAALRMDLDNRALANAVTFSRNGQFAFVTTGSSNHTIILNGATGQNVTAIVPENKTGELAPDGLVLSANDSLLYVHYFLSRQVGVYDVRGVGMSNQIPRRALVSTVEVERLPANVLKGKQVFYNAADPRMSKDGYMSCVVCHLDGGGTDGRVWDFTHKGEGLRRTPALWGRGGMSHGPLHWSANFDEVQDFESDIRNDFGGSGFIPDDEYHKAGRNTPLGGAKAGLSSDLDALSAYVKSLTQVRPSPFRTSDGHLTADARAGEVIFHRSDVGCASCHAPPRYTTSGDAGLGKLAYTTVPKLPSIFLSSSLLTQEGFLLHDVGTIKGSSGNRMGANLRGIDPPTLLGVWEGGPYLHDGSAGTLMDVITTHNAGDRHGRTQHLTRQEKEQLVAFLMQIDSRETPLSLRIQRGILDMRSTSLSVRQVDARVDFIWPGVLPGATLDILDARGVRVARLVPRFGIQSAELIFRWNMENEKGRQALHGVYFANLTAPGFKHSQRFVLAR